MAQQNQYARVRRFHNTSEAGGVVVWGVLLLCLLSTSPLKAQNAQEAGPAPDSLSLPDSTQATLPGKSRPPVYLVVGLGYGSRNDECVLCETPEDNKSFTGYLSLGRPLGYGFGIGVDVSIWRRGRPGTPLAADSTGVPGATSLSNMLGNASVSFSYDFWRIFLRAGGGVAWGSQDLEMLDGAGGIMMHTASGWGVGYSAGAGITVPVASLLSVTFFGNWNVGQYDMVSPQGLTQRGARHEYLEIGAGLAIR